MKKQCLSITAILIIISMLFNFFPVFASEKKETIDSINYDEIGFVDEKTYSFIFQYDKPDNKERVLSKMEELGCKVEYDIDYVNCISTSVNSQQLAELKEMVSIVMVERNWEYNLLSLPSDYKQKELSDYERKLLLAGNSSKEDNNNSTRISKYENKLNETNSSEVSFSEFNPMEKAHLLNIKGQNINIALFDTGISPHSDLKISGGVSFVGDGDSYIDTQGHGTQMAGIIAAKGESNSESIGVAPESNIYAVKLTEENSFINTASILKGLEWALKNDIHIINMSFGNYYSKLLDNVLKEVSNKGIIFVAAVGNDGEFEDEYNIMYPAAYESVIAVGAGNEYGTYNFSNNNMKLDFVAPGRMEVLTKGDSYTSMVGTSISSAYVTGQLAILWGSDLNSDKERIINISKNTADVSDEQVEYIGFGKIDIDESLDIEDKYVILENEKQEKNNDEVCDKILKKSNDEILETYEAPATTRTSGNCFTSLTKNAIPLGYYSNKGAIDEGGSAIWYKFVADQSTRPSQHVFQTLGSLDTIGTIFDSTGNELAHNDDSGSDLNFKIEIQLEKFKTYYIRVSAYGTNTGEFSLYVSTISDDIGNTFDSAHDMYAVYFDKP